MKEPFEHVVVLIPGIMGSVLKQADKTVWGTSPGTMLRALFSATGSVARDLRLVDNSKKIEATALLSTAHLLPGFWKIDGYDKLSQFIQSNLELSIGENYFEFPYDWRLDNRVSAMKLKRETDQWLEKWRHTSGNRSAKLVLIAHSMGGLVSRYFLEVAGGWKDTRALVTFGTPYRGSPVAIGTLVNGIELGPIRLKEITATLKGMPSVYQLLPRYSCYDQGDGNFVRLEEVSEIPGVIKNDVDSGIEFQREIEQAVENNLRDVEYVYNRYKIFPVVGITQSTLQQARCVKDRVVMLNDMGKGIFDGDGTVPRVSATPLEIQDEFREIYVGTRHSSLQSAPNIQTHLLGILNNLHTNHKIYNSELESVPGRHISVDCRDVYQSGEPIVVTALPGRKVDYLTISVTADETDEVVIKQALNQQPDGSFQGTLELQSDQAYRFRVVGDNTTDPAEDIFYVL